MRTIVFLTLGIVAAAATAAQAGETLTSQDGRFSVQVPASPLVTHEVTLNPLRQPITTYHFHIEAGGVTYNISYADGVGETPQDVYQDIAPVCSQISEAIAVWTGDVEGISFTGTLGSDFWYNYHVYQKGDRLYYIFVFAPTLEDFGRAETEIKALNDSFNIS